MKKFIQESITKLEHITWPTRKFLQESITELEHVTWPTKAETKKYFIIVTSMIGIWAVILAIFGFGVTETLFAIRSITPHEVVDTQTSEVNSDILNSFKNLKPEDIRVSGAAKISQTGSTTSASGANTSPSTSQTGAMKGTGKLTQ